jgi:hypothetical protein
MARAEKMLAVATHESWAVCCAKLPEPAGDLELLGLSIWQGGNWKEEIIPDAAILVEHPPETVRLRLAEDELSKVFPLVCGQDDVLAFPVQRTLVHGDLRAEPLARFASQTKKASQTFTKLCGLQN